MTKGKGAGASSPPAAEMSAEGEAAIDSEMASLKRLKRMWEDPNAGRESLRALINDAETGWRESKNPLFVWQAIAFSGYCTPHLPVPGWCAEYLQDIANSVIAVIFGETVPQTVNELHKVISQAFGITKPGWNARTAYDGWIGAKIETEDYDEARATGHTAAEATDLARREKHIITPDSARKRRTRARKNKKDTENETEPS